MRIFDLVSMVLSQPDMKNPKLTLYLLLVAFLSNCNRPTKNSSAESQIETRDNISAFEFHGTYLLTEEFKIADHQFNSIEIVTNDSLQGNKIELIFLRFTKPSDGEYYVVRDTEFRGTKDNFFISASDSVLGEIKITGKFLGKLGPMLDNIKDPSTIVLTGTITTGGQTKIFECRYFEGD